VAGVHRQFVSSESAGAARAGAGGHPCQGLWHTPPSGDQPRTAVIATHYDVDFAEHYLAGPLAERGVGFLGWNTRYRGLGTYFQLGPALADIGVGVRWLREVAKVDTVVILGNSGGASLMGAYQAEAQATGERPAADLFVSLCAHPGRPDILTEWLDPSVTDESDPLSIDPDLDLFSAPGPPLTEDFVRRYRAAQVARNHRISAWAKTELDRLQAGRAWDRVFTVARGWADPRFVDLSLDPSERAPGCYFGDPRTANYGPFNLAGTCTLRSWLAMWSLSDSDCRAERHLPRITVPSLVIQSTGDQGCFPSHAEAIHAQLGGADKQLAWVEGDHYLLAPPGQRDGVADLLVAWLRERSA
jgi:pimeloyl-ACP methyl ester carboxylesterase